MDREVKQRNAELSAANARLLQEVEERRRAEAKLRESEESYRLLVETMSDGFCMADENGVVTYANARMLEMMGHSRAEMVGSPSERFLDEAGQAVLREQFASRKRGANTAYEIAWIRKDGEKLHTLVSPKPLFDAEGRFKGSFAVITDVGDLKHTEETLLQWRRYLQLLSGQLMTAQEQERTRIARELHDGIGQTLTAVKFLIESASSRPAADPAAWPPEPLKLAVSKLKEAVEEVRKIGMALRPATLDDLGILATTTWFCREFQATYPDIELQPDFQVEETDVPDYLKIVVFRVLQEALHNVAKHSRANYVDVRLKKTGDVLELTVEDNGVGFEVEPVLALKSEERRLGLDSMRERTQLTGGRFWIVSAPGEGTAVRASWSLLSPETLAGAGLPPGIVL
jgi:PAS domain S-box-containing protein